MKLSIVIVNYNVKHFLEQCLHSVFKALPETDAEVFVVDNNSVDGSCHLVREKFPKVRLIENKKNLGYSVANNQAIRLSTGDYVLLLNPDTVVEEDTFTKVTGFMNNHPEAGGLGVKMINGKGKFLAESKRGLPTPWVAFYKIFGISRLFPGSKRFGKYHLSYLDKNQTHEVEILCGAFMLLRRDTLDKTGLLDETFFMYGEDIDLSYRIIKSGYKNYYFPETTIIHYKGESTRKGSINYVKMFYNAMVIFSQKHFSSRNAALFSYLIHLAIYLRATIAVIGRLLYKIYLPVIDFLIIYAGFALLLPLWEKFRFEPGYYPDTYLKVAVPVYILFWLSGIYFSSGYRKPVNLLKVGRGILWGSVAILLGYSLIAEQLRFSRALILLGSLWALVMLPLYRMLFNRLKISGFELDIERQKRIAIVGHGAEVNRIKTLLHQTVVNPILVGNVVITAEDTNEESLGTLDQLKEIIRINHINEIIFCAENLSSGEIIKAMLDLNELDVDYKIAPSDSYSIIGSNSIHTAGDLYLVNVNAISKQSNRRLKRTFDILVSVVLTLLVPFIIWILNNKTRFLLNLTQIFSGKCSWVGYIPGQKSQHELPDLKPSVLHPGNLFANQPDELQKRQLNILYAKDYRVWTDIQLLISNLKKLDNQPK